jgi:AraC family transcriptional regulator
LINATVLESAPSPPFPINQQYALSEVSAARSSLPDGAEDGVRAFPAGVVDRKSLRLNGITVELLRAVRREKFELRSRAGKHLLVVCERGLRSRGDTFVTGLPPSSLRELTRKLTFVPAGTDFYEWQEPRSLSRAVFIYFDPHRMPVESHEGFAEFAPRLYFEDATLYETALKLAGIAESRAAGNQSYMEALGVILAHELVRLNSSLSSLQPPIRGGLAAWQQRVVAAHIEEHLAEQISLKVLAQLARLSPCHFCRAFKQSFGVPPHRFHTHRRVERAKALLADLELSVTNVALMVGFNETSSFSTMFRKATGLTPSDYRRNMEWSHEAAVREVRRPIRQRVSGSRQITEYR